MSSILSYSREASRSQTNNAKLNIETAAGKKTTFVCQFNPDEFNISTQGHFSTQKRQGEDSPIIQFLGGSCSTLDLKLFFDTSSSYEMKGTDSYKAVKTKSDDVSKYTNTLMSLVCIEGKLHRPPKVNFQWGSLDFCGYVRDVKVNYTMFEQGGKPVRATVTLTIISENILELDSVKQNPKESPDRTKCIVMTSDSSLWSIAQQEYGNAVYWREIAKANDIMEPLAVSPGTYLKVPALHL